MTANIDFLQAALASIQSSQPAHQVPSNHRAPSPAFQLPTTQQRTSSTNNLFSTVSPPSQTPSFNGMNQAPFVGPAAASYTTHWSSAAPPLLPLGYGHCLQQAVLPLQPMSTPTTRGYSTTPLPFPTPPPTPATCSSLLFPFPAPANYHMVLAADTSTDYNRIPLPLSQPAPCTRPMITTPTPSPSPSPTPFAATSAIGSDTISHSLFESFLRETWPENSLRRAGSIIRDSLYEKIVSVLQGGDANGRLKQWIKRSEFFLVAKEGRGTLLAVSISKSRATKRDVGAGGGGKIESRGPYKLVAKLEDFYYIISSYHNNQTSHPGVRKTYGMIQEDYSYLPRTAVAKYIELCNICSLHRYGKGTAGKGANKSKATSEKTDLDKENCVATKL